MCFMFTMEVLENHVKAVQGRSLSTGYEFVLDH